MVVRPRKFLDGVEKVEYRIFQRRASGGRLRFAFECIAPDFAA